MRTYIAIALAAIVTIGACGAASDGHKLQSFGEGPDGGCPGFEIVPGLNGVWQIQDTCPQNVVEVAVQPDGGGAGVVTNPNGAGGWVAFTVTDETTKLDISFMGDDDVVGTKTLTLKDFKIVRGY